MQVLVIDYESIPEEVIEKLKVIGASVTFGIGAYKTPFLLEAMAEQIDFGVPKPVNRPHGPIKISKKGKVRKW